MQLALVSLMISSRYAYSLSRPHVLNQSFGLSQYLATNLTDVKPDVVVSHLSALARLARHAPGAYETRSEEITAFALETLGQPSIPEEARNLLLLG